MRRIVVVDQPKSWARRLEGVEVVSGRDYLLDSRFAEVRRARVFNLCRGYGYQKTGYYVSLLAAARGHRPLPSVETLRDLRLSPVVRVVGSELDGLIQRSLAQLTGEEFVLSIYFGANMAARHQRLARALFQQFPVPMLRATFEKERDRWSLVSVRAVSMGDVPEAHRDFLLEQAHRYFTELPAPARPRPDRRWDMAVLVNPAEAHPPSNDRAIRKFLKAARTQDIEAMVIGPEDYGSVAEFDALFIRETTAVQHHTYRFASRAAAEDLVVIDDPVSILRCTNKVFQAELFTRYRIPAPRTMIVHEDNASAVARTVGLPCVLKQPDSAFSAGVRKVSTPAELASVLEEMFEGSELVVAQEYTPSAFDWRIGVLGGRALYACRYWMAKGHWQIISREGGLEDEGLVDTLAVEEMPAEILGIAERAASLVGDGLYGVDLKDLDGRIVVTEVNDNPSIEAGYEDRVLGDELYLAVMRWFHARLEARGRGKRT
jgi:glutathione synthase/RimK-type ligase-like ATP-grasp enzyme